MEDEWILKWEGLRGITFGCVREWNRWTFGIEFVWDHGHITFYFPVISFSIHFMVWRNQDGEPAKWEAVE